MKRSLEEVLEDLRDGLLSQSDLYAFSNLSREDSGRAWQACSDLAASDRRLLVQAMLDIACLLYTSPSPRDS